MRTERPFRRRAGFSMIEVLLSLTIGSLVIAALWGLTATALQTEDITRERLRLVRDAEFAMERLVRVVGRSPRLVLPHPDRVATPQDEAVRDLLVVLLDPELDRDGDGFVDVDDDRDGRIDEDPSGDLGKDSKAGVKGIDDDLDGAVDEGSGAAKDDDDEDGLIDEELPNGIDDDGDGLVDEDLAGDRNQDGAPGVLGVDDDGDGSIDESLDADDDDEDEDVNGVDEDGPNLVIVTLQAGALRIDQRSPHATSLDTEVLAEGVVLFRVARLPRTANARADLIQLTLRLAAGKGAKYELVRRVRVGGLL